MRGFVLVILASLGACDAAVEATPLELEAHDAVNAYRADLGLPALAWSDAVSGPARDHAEAMAAGDVPFSHDGFDARVVEIQNDLPGTTAVGENVATNRGFAEPAATAVIGWIGSEGHRETMEGEWTHTGMGVAGSDETGWFFAQLFARVR